MDSGEGRREARRVRRKRRAPGKLLLRRLSSLVACGGSIPSAWSSSSLKATEETGVVDADTAFAADADTSGADGPTARGFATARIFATAGAHGFFAGGYAAAAGAVADGDGAVSGGYASAGFLAATGTEGSGVERHASAGTYTTSVAGAVAGATTGARGTTGTASAGAAGAGHGGGSFARGVRDEDGRVSSSGEHFLRQSSERGESEGTEENGEQKILLRRGGRRQEGNREVDVGGPEKQARRLPRISMGTLGESFEVREKGSKVGAATKQRLEEGTTATPPRWDSTLCMAHWGVADLQYTPDPNGYVIYVDGREQLGGNKFLVSDGMFMAKSLNRTFVEYPVRDARIVKLEEASLGLGAYWDLSELCMYHRILDLGAFSKIMANGSIPPEDFVTVRSDSNEVLLRGVNSEDRMVKLFQDFKDAKVIVLELAWKSGIFREALQYLRPNPFYMGIVKMLLEGQKDWANGDFIAVQWRTELSFGDLTECYEEVKAVIEEERWRLGYGSHQVFFNIDLYGKTSGTYGASAQAAGAAVLELINEDYPQALRNNLHHFFAEIDDSGVRALVSGLAVASSKVMIGSSLNKPAAKVIPAASRCQKPYSGYITLITEWRDEILHKPDDSVIRMFPFEYLPPPEPEPEPEENEPGT